jgi:uncharacterized protein YgbK (DUF1537 family)
MRTPRLTILADDLTGAADCGLQAAARGLVTVVALDAAEVTADVVARDLDTRGGDADRAYEATRAAAAAASGAVYLKVDSTLRGHLGAAIDAALDAGAGERAVVAPAFPAQGRTVVDGRLHLDGEASADLVALLRAQSRHPARVVLARDAQSDDDLRRVVEEFGGERVVWVGSAGLAAALAEKLAPEPTPARRPAPPPAGGPIVIVVGSRAAPIPAQARALLARPGVVPVDPAALPEALRTGADAVLRARGDATTTPAVAAALARAVAEAARETDLGGLILTGGETARRVCEALDIAAIALDGAVEPGVALGRAVGRDTPIVTKAGGFGDASTLVRAYDALKGH